MNQLLELLTPEKALFGQCVKDWEAAVRLAGDLLLEAGDVTEDYIESAVQAAVDMGAYFVVRPSVALSHARPGEHVCRTGLSLVTLDPPVYFGHPDNDPVSLLFMFATSDNQSHLELLKDIAKLLCSDETVARVIEAASYKELQGLLEQVLVKKQRCNPKA